MSRKANDLVRAENLYMRKGKSIAEISELLGVNSTTLYRWKKEGDWEQRRIEFLRSSISIADKLKDALANLVSKLKKTEIDPKEADALVKMVKAIKVVNSEADIIGATLVIMDELLRFLKEKDKKAAEIVDEYIPAFGQYMWEKYGNK